MAENNVRSGQVLSPFGIGQIVNFPKEVSLMICGLNLWDEKLSQRRASGGFIDESSLKISEPRLQRLLGVEYFKRPYPYIRSGLKNTLLTLPAVRFPKWHHCTNSGCGRMREVELTLSDEKVECPNCKSKMIPVRFVAACEHGHIQDVPFREWAHNGPVPNDGRDHLLTYQSISGSGDLGSIFIKCSCGQASRSLAGLMNVRKEGTTIIDSALAGLGLNREDADISASNPNNTNILGQYCRGEKPWLGLTGVVEPDRCQAHLRVLIRGGSNVHYSNIMSALFLPESEETANPSIESVIRRLGKPRLRTFLEQDSSGAILTAVLEAQPEVLNGSISSNELNDGILRQINRIEDVELKSEFDLRHEEYSFILKGYNSENGDLKAIKKKFENYADRMYLEQFFDHVVLIEKLKEARVFTGFSRITADNSAGTRPVKIKQLSTSHVTWLPAYEVYGEGIFLKFKDGKIDEWLKVVDESFATMIERYHLSMQSRSTEYEPRDVSPSFIMMHTFAHLLIKRLCYNCGYGSSSLRERIYFSTHSGKRMNGILIYTSSGDSEGSLGGLVRQGKELFLSKLIRDTIEDAKWCSADPVCSDIGQLSGQGPNNINGSACHNCCIVPETSCEEFNGLLDRATIVGTFTNPKLGFFSSISN